MWVSVRDAYGEDQRWKNEGTKMNWGITKIRKQRGKQGKRDQLNADLLD